MRAGLHRWLDSIWYGGRRVPRSLHALEWIYRRILRLRRLLYARGWMRSERLPAPVLVVGNVTVGGTGKTPLTLWLVEELCQRGWRPGVILRGYGGRARGALLVEPGTDPALCGDEAVLIARATRVPVAVGRRRVEAGRLLLARGGCDLLIADDGLQHWALARDVEIAVVDGVRRFGNGRLLPAGPLRESMRRLDRVDFVVVNGAAAHGEVGMTVAGQRAVSLLDPTCTRPLSEFRGLPVHAVAGIGNPERFFTMLEALGLEVRRHPLPDHHEFRGDEFAFDDGLPVLVTEKDAVKCARFADASVWAVPVEAELPAGFADRVHAALHAHRSLPA